MWDKYILENSIQDSFHQGNLEKFGDNGNGNTSVGNEGNTHVWSYLQYHIPVLILWCLMSSKRSYILKQTCSGLFKYVWPFTGHEALKG